MFEGTKMWCRSSGRTMRSVSIGVCISPMVRNQVMVFDPKTHAAQPLGESGPGVW